MPEGYRHDAGIDVPETSSHLATNELTGRGAGPPSGGSDTTVSMLVVVLVLGGATWLRLHQLGAQALWVDEYATLLVARHSLGEIPDAALRGNAFGPPVYFWVAHVFRQVFGETEAALRLPSALAGILTVGLFWRLIRGAGGGTEAALLGAALLAAHPLHLWYSQEARPYATTLFFGVWSLVQLLRARRTGAAFDWCAYAVLTSLAILTHLAGIVFPIAGTLWVMIGDRRGTTLKALAASFGAVVVLVLPFVIALVGSTGTQGTGSPPRPITGLEIPYTLLTFVGGYSLGPSVREIQDLGWREAVAAQPTQAALAAIVLLTVAVLGLRAERRLAMPFAVLFAVPIAIAFGGAALTGKAYTVRYALPGMLGLLGIASLGVVAVGQRLRWICTAVLLLVFAWGDLQWFRTPQYWKEDSRLAVGCLRAALPPGSVVTVAPDYMIGVLDYYAQKAGADLTFVPVPKNAVSLRALHSDALLVTRLHHVDKWSEFSGGLRPGPGGPAKVEELGGYRVYLWSDGQLPTCSGRAP
jgi:mannosyltransferase